VVVGNAQKKRVLVSLGYIYLLVRYLGQNVRLVALGGVPHALVLGVDRIKAARSTEVERNEVAAVLVLDGLVSRVARVTISTLSVAP